METVIDRLNSTTGWTAPASTITFTANGHSQYCADLETVSLMVDIPAGNLNKTFAKTISPAVSVAGYNEIVLSIKSFRQVTGPLKKKSEAMYKLTLASGQTFYIPVFQTMAQVIIPVDALTSVNQMTFTVLHNLEDQLILSYCVAVKYEIPLDVMKGVKRFVEAERDALYGYGKKIGTITCAAGEKTPTVVTNYAWIERYAVIQIRDGTHSEIHQIIEIQNNKIAKMNTDFDGPQMLNAFTAGDVYITFPIEIGKLNREIFLPGVMVWYMAPQPVQITGKLDREPLVFTETHCYIRREGLRWKCRVMMDTEARSAELIADITTAIRKFLAKERVWIYGKKFWFEWKESPTETEPIEDYDIIPKSAYIVDIEIKEQVWQPEKLIVSTEVTLTETPEALPSS